MKIDWFTVIAQVVNFLILVWLMKRFLYKPVLMAIEEREKEIVSRLNAAESKSREANKIEEEFKNKSYALEQDRNDIIKRTEEEVALERIKLLNEVKQEADVLRMKLQKSIKEEHQRLNGEVAVKVQQEVFSVVRKVLKDLSSSSLEEQIAEVFVKKLGTLGEEERQKLLSAFNTSNRPAIVRSAFELSPLQKKKMVEAVREVFKGAELIFEIDPAQIGGVTITTDSYELSWNMKEYLNLLENNVSAFMKKNSAILR